MTGLFGGAAGRMAGRMSAALGGGKDGYSQDPKIRQRAGLSPVRDEEEEQRRRRGLFGGGRERQPTLLGGLMSFMNAEDGGVSNWQNLQLAAAMMRDDPSFALAAQQRLDNQRADYQAEQAREQEQQQGREQAKQEAQSERLRLNALADTLGLQGQERALFLMSPEDARNEFIGSRMNPEPMGAPTTRTVNRGGEIVTEQWNPQTQQFEEIGRAPRWNADAQPLVTFNEGEQSNPYAEAYRAATEEHMQTILTEVGPAAERRALQLDRLDGLLAANETGLGAAARLFASDFGLEIGENVGELQAARALINSLVPELRPPNSGTFTDADARLARESLPRLINTPGGNELVMGALRRINDYDRQLYRLTQQVGRGDITEQQYNAAVAALANPLDPVRDALNGAIESPQGGPATRITSDDEYDALPSGSLYVGPDGVTRRKP